MSFTFTGTNDYFVRKIIENVVNAMPDDLIKEMAGAWLKQFQLSGETYRETMARITNDTVTLTQEFAYTSGVELDRGHSAIFSQRMIQTWRESDLKSGKAGDALTNLVNNLEFIYNNFSSGKIYPLHPETPQSIKHLALTILELSSAQNILFETADTNYSGVDFNAIYENNSPALLFTDNPIFKWQAVAGTTYDLYSVDTLGVLDFLDITLFDDTGKPIAVSPLSGDSYAKISNFTASYTGTYYVDAGWSTYSKNAFVDLQIDSHVVNHLPTGSVTITGTPKQSQTLTVSNTLSDFDGLGIINYQWLSNGDVISGANKTTYSLTQADVGKSISVKASYTDLKNFTENVTSNAVTIANVNDKPTGLVTISGDLQTGSTIYENDTLIDADGLGTLSYQWIRNQKPIDSATGDHYKLTESDVGKKISVKVSYTDKLGTPENVTSQQTTAIKKYISSTPTDGNDSITGTNGDDIIDGKLGADTMVGGFGSDDYYVDDKGDKIVEYQAGGSDIVGSTLKNYSLGSNVENLLLLGSENINGTGNSLKNLIVGNDSNNVLNGGDGDDKLGGGKGADTLIGGAGADIFAFTNLTDSGTTTETRDTIKDFNHSDGDKIKLMFDDAITSKFTEYHVIYNKSFGGIAGEIKFVDSVLSIDIDGDKVADFSVKIIGMKLFDISDFNVTSTFDYLKSE